MGSYKRYNIQYPSDSIEITDKMLTNLLSVLEKADEDEAKALYLLLQKSISPYTLKQKLNNKNLLIQKFVKRRYDELYTLSSLGLEWDFASRLDLKAEGEWSLEEFEEASDSEYEVMNRETKEVRSGIADDECQIDHTEAIELLRYNFELALTSPQVYIRTLAKMIIDREGKYDR